MTQSHVGQDVTIHHDDCAHALAQVQDQSIDLIFADPPYNIGKKFGDFEDSWPTDEAYAEWCYSWLELCLRKLTPSGSMYVMITVTDYGDMITVTVH